MGSTHKWVEQVLSPLQGESGSKLFSFFEVLAQVLQSPLDFKKDVLSVKS